MTCGTTRKIIYLANQPEPWSAHWVAAQEHLNHCQECQALFSRDEALRRLLRTRFAGQDAPAHLRERVLDRIAQARTSERSSEHSWVPRQQQIRAALLIALLGGIVLVAGILGYPMLVGDRPQRVAAVMVEDHLQFGPGVSAIESSQAEQVETWFRGKVDFAVHVPRVAHAELVGGRRCSLFGKHGALLSYRTQGTPVSLYIFEGTEVNPARFERLDLGEHTFTRASSKGHSLLLWKNRGLAYTLVSELPEQELVRLAAGIAEQGR